ncbi:RluA-2 [Drosophila busckii]|uniref:RluA-2 n=1 Tax=Drosophila busckii TaxID=30019 RepID=A0A0M3QTP7_DROBS|nr:RluA-2 [Drosophila busckii]
MTLPRSQRHVQTQHGDEHTADIKNIFLFQAALQDNQPNAADAAVDATATVAAEDKAVEGKECVWIHDSDANDDRESPPAQLPEKRKAPITIESPAAPAKKKAKVDTKELKATRPGFNEERYDETSYYIENSLRKVYPYFFTFTTFTKGRWVGESILDVFSREFRAQPPEEYKRSIEAGTLTVNHEQVPIDYKLKHNDLLANTVHRHEVPVTAQPISIVHMDEHIVVVNKPASIPVHPCGRYRHNTAIFILAKEFNLRNLLTIHRLDRLTSGLLLFGRTKEKARELEQQIRNRQVQKEYVCRVEGHFPDGLIECNEPIEVVSYKIGVCRVSAKGKDCKTTFKKLAQADNYSIVQCFPILNDPLYNHEVFGPLKGRGGDTGGKTSQQLINDLINIHNAENWLGIEGEVQLPLAQDNDVALSSPVQVVATAVAPKTLLEHNVATQTGHDEPDSCYNAAKLTTDPNCNECKITYREPQPKDLVMYLHAWKYKGIGWSYETKLPSWAFVDKIAA